ARTTACRARLGQRGDRPYQRRAFGRRSGRPAGQSGRGSTDPGRRTGASEQRRIASRGRNVPGRPGTVYAPGVSGARLRRTCEVIFTSVPAYRASANWFGALAVEPPHAGEQYELDVCEVQRRQRRGDAPLPTLRADYPSRDYLAIVRSRPSAVV